jgi:hypothetical protein
VPRVIHFEIHADQPERAVKFYAGVFGWEITKWDGPMPYWLIKTGSGGPGIDGGLMPRQGPPPGDRQPVNSYVCTLDVPNLDEYLGKVQAAGGHQVVDKMHIPGVGWIAYVKDTEGNILGLIQPER